MSHFEALVARSNERWRGVDTDVEIGELEDIEDVADAMRDVAIDDGPVLLFVEQDDEWFGIVRVDGAADPKTFISDARVIETSELATTLFGDLALEPAAEPVSQRSAESAADEDDIGSDDEERASEAPRPEPAGAADMLADFGISGPTLLELCAEEGALPADVITSVCERLGCADEIEVYR